jgi:hypothetical protein
VTRQITRVGNPWGPFAAHPHPRNRVVKISSRDM